MSQRLAPKIGGGRYALLEILGGNIRTKDSIVMGESEGRTFYDIIEANYTFGWRHFDHACLDAYEGCGKESQSPHTYRRRRIRLRIGTGRGIRAEQRRFMEVAQ